MKKFFIYQLIIILCFVISACNNCQTTSNNDFSSNIKDNQDMNNDFKLIVNDCDISLENYISVNFQKKYAKLPLIAIAKALECDVKWYNANKVIITFEDTIYILNPTKKTLKKKGDTFNIIALPPGTNHSGYCQINKNEFIIDSDSIRLFINMLGAKITINYDTGIINIKTEKTGDGSVS